MPAKHIQKLHTTHIASRLMLLPNRRIEPSLGLNYKCLKSEFITEVHFNVNGFIAPVAMQQTAKIPIPQQTADNISYSGCFTQTQAALPNLSWKASKNPHH